MEYFKNKSEKFFREIRQIEIHLAADISYQDNFNGIIPSRENALYIFDVIPETFERKIPTKTNNGNYFYDADCGFPLLDMKKHTVDELFQNLNRQAFAVIFVSNIQKTLIGNDRFPLTVQIIDNVMDDNSGNDEYSISIIGGTVLYPKFTML